MSVNIAEPDERRIGERLQEQVIRRAAPTEADGVQGAVCRQGGKAGGTNQELRYGCAHRGVQRQEEWERGADKEGDAGAVQGKQGLRPQQDCQCLQCLV